MPFGEISERKALLRSYATSLRTFYSSLSQARLLRIATEANSDVIPASEGGRNDLGLYIGSGTLEGDATDRLLMVLGLDEQTCVEVPMEVKTVCPSYHVRENTVTWEFRLTKAQVESCQIVLLATIKDPQFVALLPTHLMHNTNKRTRRVRNMGSLKFKFFWTLHALPAFPPEWEPFLFPIPQLGASLTDTRRYTDGTDHRWTNSYSGVHFPGVPRPTAFPMSALLPDFSEWGAALHAAMPMIEAFREFSTVFKVEFVEISPILPDLRITHIPSGTIIYVELKMYHCKVIGDPTTRSPIVKHYQQARGFNSKLLFTWKTSWDYLLTTITPGELGTRVKQKKALCIPRDDIPTHWWNRVSPSITPSKVPLLTWTSPEAKWLDKYLIDWPPAEESVRRLESILCSSPMKATKKIQMEPLPQWDDQDPSEDPAVEEMPSPVDHSGSSKFRIGFGSHQHPTVKFPEDYDYWAYEVLTEVCRQRGQCVVLDFGRRNSMGRFAVTTYPWTKTDKTRYDQDGEPPRQVRHFHRKTPILRINFLPFRLGHIWRRTIRDDGGRYERFEKFHPALVICDTYPASCLRIQHSRFVVPSGCLPAKEISNGAFALEGEKGIVLDQFLVDADDLIDTFQEILDGNEETRIGVGQVAVNTKDYCCLLSDMKQAGVSGICDIQRKQAKAGHNSNASDREIIEEGKQGESREEDALEGEGEEDDNAQEVVEGEDDGEDEGDDGIEKDEYENEYNVADSDDSIDEDEDEDDDNDDEEDDQDGGIDEDDASKDEDDEEPDASDLDFSYPSSPLASPASPEQENPASLRASIFPPSLLTKRNKVSPRSLANLESSLSSNKGISSPGSASGGGTFFLTPNRKREREKGEDEKADQSRKRPRLSDPDVNENNDPMSE